MENSDNRTEKRKLGDIGENVACDFLKKRGFEIKERNYLRKWGEIDIIGLKDGKLSFFEVKTRLSDGWGKPYEAVNFTKVKRLMRPIQYFLLQNNYKNYKLSLDVISIELNKNLTIKSLRHYENVRTHQ